MEDQKSLTYKSNKLLKIDMDLLKNAQFLLNTFNLMLRFIQRIANILKSIQKLDQESQRCKNPKISQLRKFTSKMRLWTQEFIIKEKKKRKYSLNN
jgi:hypothetical protein